MANSYIDKGTLITVEDGSKVAIEDLKVGDKVQTYNMSDEDFDQSHLGLNEQIAVKIAEINLETIPGDQVNKVSLSNKSELSISGCDLFSAFEGKGILALPSDEVIGGDEEGGRVDIVIGDIIYIDSGEKLSDVSVEGIEEWKNSREMYNIWVEGGTTVFANEALVSVDRRKTEEEEEAVELARLAGEDREVTEEEAEALEQARLAHDVTYLQSLHGEDEAE